MRSFGVSYLSVNQPFFPELVGSVGGLSDGGYFGDCCQVVARSCLVVV